MTWTAALVELDAKLTTVGAALTYPCGLVRQGPPIDARHQICYWYEGRIESRTGGDTLGKVNPMERVRIAFLLPVGIGATDAAWAAYDLQMRDFVDRLTTELVGGSGTPSWNLAGNAIGLETEDAAVDLVAWQGSLVLSVEVPLLIDMAETSSIEPNP